MTRIFLDFASLVAFRLVIRYPIHVIRVIQKNPWLKISC